MKEESREKKYVRWAIGDALLGRYEKALRAIKWAKEARDEVQKNEILE